MPTQIQLNADILKLTLYIQEKHPELSKYIAEMPITIPNEKTPEINIQNLTIYLNNLNHLLKKYSATYNHNINII